MKTVRLMIAGIVALGLTGCTPEDREMAEQIPAVVEKAVAFVTSLGERAENVQDALREQGLTVDGLDSLMYEIAASPELTEQFNQARQ